MPNIAPLTTQVSGRWRAAALACGALLIALCAGCGRDAQPVRAVPQPVQATPTQAAQPADPSSFLPTPPLVSPVPVKPRTVSAGQAPMTANEVFAHDNGGNTGPGQAGAYAIDPVGDDELAWAVYQVAIAKDDRPTAISNSVQAIDPVGDDELSFWVAAYSFSQARWEWIGPDGGPAAPWTADGVVSIGLNTPGRRARFCNLGDGLSVQSYVAIVVMPKARGGGKGLNVDPGSLSFVSSSDPSYVKTEPLPASIPGAFVDTPSSQIRLFFDNLASDGANGCIIQRRSLASTQWVDLAKPSFVPTNHNDPDDNDPPGSNAPTLTAPYEYRAIAFAKDGATELYAAPSNYQTLHGWYSLEIAPGGAAGCLAEVDGRPAVAYHKNGTELNYAIATTGSGLQPGDWHGSTFGSADGTSNDFSLKYIADAPCIAYYDATAKQIGFLRAFDKHGTGTWTSAQVESSTDDLGYYCSLADIGGHPAVVYCDKTNSELHYNRATTTLGNQGEWGTPVVLPKALTGEGYSACLVALSNGHPAVACYDEGGDQVVFGAATSSDGMQAADWVGQFSPVGSLGTGGTPPLSRFISLAVINGNPAVSYWNVGNGNLYYQNNPVADGSGLWNPAVSIDSNNIAESNSLAEVPDGAGGTAPAVGYCALPSSVEEPHYCRSDDADGVSWNSLQTVSSPALDAGAQCSLAVIAGRPALVYTANTGLQFAMYF